VGGVEKLFVVQVNPAPVTPSSVPPFSTNVKLLCKYKALLKVLPVLVVKEEILTPVAPSSVLENTEPTMVLFILY